MNRMSTQNINTSQKPDNTPQNNGGFHGFILTYLTLNGIATGNVIKCANHMINNGYDRDTTIVMLLYLLLCTYTAQRIYEINRDRKNRNNNNNKTR